MTTEDVNQYIVRHKCILSARTRAKLRQNARTDPDGAFMEMLEKVEKKMEVQRVTQCEMILKYIRENGSITDWEAMKHIGCMRLGSRICDLRKMGHQIHTNMETSMNRYGVRTSYARYTLTEGAENG